MSWIAEQTSPGRQISATVPLAFDAYATIVTFDEPQERIAAAQALIEAAATTHRGATRGGWDTWRPAPLTWCCPRLTASALHATKHRESGDDERPAAHAALSHQWETCRVSEGGHHG